MQDLRVSLVQGDTRWHDPAANRAYYGHLVAPLHGTTDLVLLPETFTSGFSNDAITQAETMDGPTIDWLREQAAKIGAAICGSVQIRDGDGVYNRMCFVTPDGALSTYDKRHLFRYAKEHERYAAGHDRMTIELQGLAYLSAGLLRPALPGVFAQSLRCRTAPGPGLRLAGVRGELAVGARACLEAAAARACDREPVLRRRPQPRRHRRQRPAVLAAKARSSTSRAGR
jgi:hypothetical protein